MRFLCTALLLAFAARLPAQSTEADLRAQLINKPLYLRGLWSNDRLYFDATGKPSAEAGTTPVTLDGMNVKSVRLTPRGLILEGTRAGLTFENDKPKRVNVSVNEGDPTLTHDRKMHVEIQPPTNGDYTRPLHAIFTESVADLVPTLPQYWQDFFEKHLLEVQTMRPIDYKPDTLGLPPAPAGVERVGGSVTVPRILNRPEPSVNEEARVARLTGKVLVYFRVNKTGNPYHIRILHPLGLGLDEQAVVAASQYRFAPATRDGVPVAVELNVEVSF